MDEKALKVMVGSMGDMMAAMASVYGDAILKLCEQPSSSLSQDEQQSLQSVVRHVQSHALQVQSAARTFSRL